MILLLILQCSSCCSLLFVGNFLHKQNLRLMKDGASQAAVRVKLEWKQVDAMDEKQLLDAWQVPSAQPKGIEENKKKEATKIQKPIKTKKTGKLEIKRRWKICQRLNFNTYEHSYKHVYILNQGIHRGNIHGRPARSAFGSNDPNRGKIPIRQWHCWKGLFHHKLGNDATRVNTTLESTNYIYIIRCECIQGFVDRNYSFWGVLTSNGGVVVATADRVLLIGPMGLVYLSTLTYIYLIRIM